MTAPERRNDPQHFPAVNGPGHRRRKVVNLPAEHRYVMDRYEVRALEMIGELDRWLAAEQDRQLRAAQARGLERRGDPGE